MKTIISICRTLPVLLVFAWGRVEAQQPISDTTAAHTRLPSDTLRTEHPPSPLHDSLTTPPLRTKSPGTAMLLSALVPGAGQFYNESYWKVPIVTGMAVYFVSEWLTNNRRYKDYRDQFAAYLAAHPGDLTLDQSTMETYLLNNREFYKDQRDSFAWYYLILYVVSLADAYVDASLFSFDVGGSLAMNGMPQPRLTLRWKF